MRGAWLMLLMIVTVTACAQSPDPAKTASLAQMNFLLGTWSAQTVPMKGAPALALGEYTFRYDLLKNVITRVSVTDACASPKSLNCQHYDALTVYRDAGDPVLHALYLDSQGHTIHYSLSFPDPGTVIFFSTGPGLQSRLVYHIQKNILTGKLQSAPAGSTNFVSSLEWFGVRMPQTEAPPAARPASSSHALDALENNARVLLVFAPQSADGQFRQQMTSMAGQSRELTDRNLIVIPVLTRWSVADKDLHDRNLPFTEDAEQRYIRQRFKVPANSFAVILLGKDGGEKLNAKAPILPAKLFGLIDDMPMRRQEMRSAKPAP